MSRSNPNENMKHPSTMWIEYDGANGGFRYYDKEHLNQDGSRGANIDLGKKLSFMFLDQTYSVTGWNDTSHSGIYANEVKNISSGILTVKAFKGQGQLVGNWNSIKDRVRSMGGKFTANIYVAIKTKSGLTLATIQLKGSAFAKWNDFKKAVGDKAVESGAVSVVNHLDGKKGAVSFKTPVFELISEISPESNIAAIELDKELQSYLKQKISDVDVPEVTEDDGPVQIDEPVRTSISKKPAHVETDEEIFGEAVQQDNGGGFDDDDFDDSLPF
jgi:hypothetical protein